MLSGTTIFIINPRSVLSREKKTLFRPNDLMSFFAEIYLGEWRLQKCQKIATLPQPRLVIFRELAK
jgi:hypothetical protein